MGFLRKCAVVVAASILTTSLFTFGLLFGLRQVFGSPGPIEQALDKSGIYSSILTDSLKESQGNATPSQDVVPVDQKAVREAFAKAFPPATLKADVEMILNATYAWMQGKTDNLNFRVDLAPAKQALADNLAAYVQERMNALPVCTSAAEITPTVNPYTVNCLPPGFNKASAAAEARQQILDDQSFLKETVLTPATIKNSKGQTLDQQFAVARKGYHWAVLAVYLAALVAALTAVGLVFLYKNHWDGAKRVAFIAITIGLVSGFQAWLGAFGLQKASEAMERGNVGVLSTKIMDAIRLLASDLRKWWIGYGVGLVIIGVGLLVARKLLRRKPSMEAPPERPEPPETPQEKAAETPPAEATPEKTDGPSEPLPPPPVPSEEVPKEEEPKEPQAAAGKKDDKPKEEESEEDFPFKDEEKKPASKTKA